MENECAKVQINFFKTPYRFIQASLRAVSKHSLLFQSSGCLQSVILFVMLNEVKHLRDVN